MKVSFFIDENDELCHWCEFSFNYDLTDLELDLINKFGKEYIIKTVKKMSVYQTIDLNDYIKLVRFI